MKRTAEISPCGEYRTSLSRVWDDDLPMASWIALNPSKADGEKDDPSVRKMIGFSSRLGYGGFWLYNIFPLRATDPRELLTHPDPCGHRLGDTFSLSAIADAATLWTPDPPIVAWGGIHKKLEYRAAEMMTLLVEARCFGWTKDGQPRHPLMLAYSTPIENTKLVRE